MPVVRDSFYPLVHSGPFRTCNVRRVTAETGCTSVPQQDAATGHARRFRCPSAPSVPRVEH